MPLEEVHECFQDDEEFIAIENWWQQIKMIVKRFKPGLIPADDEVHENDFFEHEVDFIAFELCKNGELFDYIVNSGAFSEKIARFYMK